MKAQSSFTEQDLRQVEKAAQREKHKTFVEVLKSKGYNDYELFLDHLLFLSPKSAKFMLKKEVIELVPGTELRKVRIGRLNGKTTMSVQENSIDYCSKNNRNISVVLVGKTGSGKSSTANTLVGKGGAFITSQYFHQSCTDKIQLEQTLFENTCLKVMDTPGLFDTRGTIFQGMDNDARLLEIAKAVLVFPDGIDVFLIVCRLDEPFTQETQNAIEQIEKRFGGNLHFYDHCILILTRGKEMQTHTLKEHLAQSCMPYNLSQLIQKVQNRVIVVENKWKKSKHFKEFQREWLISQICSFIMQKDSVRRGKYTNKHFTIAQQLLKSKAEDDLRKFSARKYTASFVRAYIKGADEETLQRLMNDKTLNENEISKLKAFIEEKNLLTEHINVDISALASQIVSSSESIIQKQLVSRSREKDTIKQLKMDKTKQAETLEMKYQVQISILHFMDKNKNSLPSLQSLLDPSTIPRDLFDYVNESQNYRLMECEKTLGLTKKVLSDIQNIIELGIQIIQKEATVYGEIALEPNSESLTMKVLNVFNTFDINALNDLKCNTECGHLEKSIIWQQLSTLKLSQMDNSRNLILAIVNKHIDSCIEVKKLEYSQMKGITKQKHLLKVENAISSQLFQEIERGDEKMLEELVMGKSQQKIFKKLDIELKEYPEISEEDIKSSFELSLQSIISIMKRRYNDVKTLRKELDEALKAHEKAEEERDKAEQRINDIVNEFSEKFIRGLKKRDMLKMKEQFEANELTIPPKLFEKIKRKILQDHTMSDEEIQRIINSVVRSKKQILEEIMNQESCFPSTSVITTLQAGKIPIGAVTLGDKVLTVKENSVIGYEKIFFIAHANKSGFFCYLIIETSSKTSIAISPNHCLPVGNIKCMKPANQVKVNDLIFVNRDGIIISDTVTSIKREFRRGAYCPYTLNGTLIVDNIVTSCFTTTVAPHIAQRVLFPLRCLYRCTPLPLYKTVFSNRKMKFISERANVGSHVTEHILLYITKAF
ncbi:GTPase IMAP family member 7 [Holothuria leucospilota]|uniref:GTPase IMAP family member 7 n=1 Tax=Holothuria leucospilota TaxID=206669 RepID=A0A9Q1H921_HOLLE|nr:GTPase IMAP family member 7 [Holothuria leucospilota]